MEESQRAGKGRERTAGFMVSWRKVVVSGSWVLVLLLLWVVRSLELETVTLGPAMALGPASIARSAHPLFTTTLPASLPPVNHFTSLTCIMAHPLANSTPVPAQYSTLTLHSTPYCVTW